MPFDGSGNYTPPAAPAFPAVTTTTISSAYYNQVINDLAAAISNTLTRDGQGKPTAAYNWNNQQLSGVNGLDALTYAAGGYGVRIRQVASGSAILQFTNSGGSTQLGAVYHDGNNLYLSAGVGNILAPTMPTADNSTAVGTTAYVQANLTAFSTTIAGTYLTQVSAASTYLPLTTAASTYLSQTSAASTYLSQVSAASTYVSNSSLSTSLTAYLAKTGGTLTGPLITTASIAGAAGLNIPAGTAPSSPNNGDVWTTALGLFLRIAGVTQQMQYGLTFTSNANGVAVGIPIGGTTYYLQMCPFGAVGGGSSVTVTYPVAFASAVKGAVATKETSSSINDGINLYNAPGLSSATLMNGGTGTSGGYLIVFGY